MARLKEILPTLPDALLEPLESSYREIKDNFYEGRFEPAELNAAKFCEVVYRILQWYTSGGTPNGIYTPFGTTIRNLAVALRRFEGMAPFDESVRMHIPKTLDTIYAVRNHRGVGHIGSAVDPNYMDSVFVVSACDWVLADLVRLFHGDTPAEAQKIIEDIVTKKVPLIWKVGDVRRVLDAGMTAKDETLVLLYAEHPNPVKDTDLGKWIEYSNIGVYLVKVLQPLHHQRLVEYDRKGSGMVRLSPTGRRYIEDNLHLSI